MSTARRRRRYLRLARYQRRVEPMMPGGLVPSFARAAWSWFKVWPWTPGQPPAVPWRKLRVSNLSERRVSADEHSN